MQPRQSAWHRRANRRAPSKPADGKAVRTGCENGTPRCLHRFTHAVLSTVALCANSQEGSTPTRVRSDRLIIVTHVVAVRRCSLACGLQVHTTLGVVMFYLGCHTSSWAQSGDELQISRTNRFMARTDSFNLSFTSTMLAYLHHLLITINPESRLKRLGFTGRCCAVLCAAVVGKQRRQSSCCHTTWSLLPHSPSIH